MFGYTPEVSGSQRIGNTSGNDNKLTKYLHHSICYQLEGSHLGNIEVCSSKGQNDTSTEEE